MVNKLKCWDWIVINTTVAIAKSLQLCPTLCDPIDGSPPGFPIPGILQVRTHEWVAISFSNAWKWSHSVMFDPQQPHGLQPTRLLHPWDFPGKSTGVGRHCLLRESLWFLLFSVWRKFTLFFGTPHDTIFSLFPLGNSPNFFNDFSFYKCPEEALASNNF